MVRHKVRIRISLPTPRPVLSPGIPITTSSLSILTWSSLTKKRREEDSPSPDPIGETNFFNLLEGPAQRCRVDLSKGPSELTWFQNRKVTPDLLPATLGSPHCCHPLPLSHCSISQLKRNKPFLPAWQAVSIVLIRQTHP